MSSVGPPPARAFGEGNRDSRRVVPAAIALLLGALVLKLALFLLDDGRGLRGCYATPAPSSTSTACA